MPTVALNAHLLARKAGYRTAGIHGYMYQTLAHLPSVAPDWTFKVLVGEGQPPKAPQIEVIRSEFSTNRPIKRIIWEQALQGRAVKSTKAELYHSLAFVTPRNLPSIPSLVTVYDLSFLRYPDALSRARRWYLSTFTASSCRSAARVIAISESTARDISHFFDIDPAKITVAVPGIGENFKPLLAAEIQAFRQRKDLSQKFLLHLGTLEPRKNLPMLIRAYAALPKDLRESVPLILAGGKGWDYAEIFETIDAHDLGQQVRAIGFVDSDELPLWYNAATALVYPSLFEGWGLPVTEAMACGCPTLVSNVSSLPEAAGDTGMMMPPDDEYAWTNAMQHALTDSAWQEESRRAGIERIKQFTWRQTAQSTLNAYHAALGES